MRWMGVWLALWVSGCYAGPTSEDGAGGGSVCDGKATCNECLQCADANPCASVVNNCLNDSACYGVNECVNICGADTTCQNQCLMNNPQGAALFNAAQDCRYCDECPGDCAGFRDCS